MAYHNHLEELEDLGEAVQDIIDSAVRSQNYQKLNKTVTDAVNKAVDSGTEAIRRAAAEGTLRRTDNRVNKNVYSSKLSSVPSQRPRPQQVQPTQNLPVLYRSTNDKMAGGIVKTVFGSLVTAGSAVDLGLTLAARLFFEGASFLSFASMLMLGFLGGGVWLLSSGIRSITKVNRFRKYVSVLGQKTYCTVEQLARMVGKPTKFVRKELPRMIEEGYFLEGHMDEEGTSLITSNETYRHYRQSQEQLAERQRLEKEQKEAQARLEKAEEVRKSMEKKVDARVQEVLDRGNAFIREIRRCNDRIPGEEISAKIYRMETIVQKIFDRAEAHPEIVPDLKKLMDYYLPMTVKLLNAYAEMDAQPIQGETIQNSKREIEATLDTLNLAFEKLLDSVFKDTAMDVSSDISVLQTLLAQEGLTDDELGKLKKEQIGM